MGNAQQDFCKLEDIVEYYDLGSIELMVFDVSDAAARDEMVAFAEEMKVLGIDPFAKVPVQFGFDGEEIVDYAYECAEKYQDTFDVDGWKETFPSPVWLFAVMDEVADVDLGEFDDAWETCTPYFDKSFGNYLPDYEEHSRTYTAYLDSTGDGLFMSAADFKSNIMEPIRRIVEAGNGA